MSGLHETIRRLGGNPFVRCTLVAACGMLVYLLVRESSQARDLAFLPQWLTSWADSRDHAPHFVAFFLVSFPAFLFRFPEREIHMQASPYGTASGERFRSGYQGLSLFFFLGLAVLLESVQQGVATRSYNPNDMAANVLGVCAAWSLWRIAASAGRVWEEALVRQSGGRYRARP